MANRLPKAGLAYNAKAESPTMSWRQVADETGFGCERECRKQARAYARRNSLTWPLGREALTLFERERFWNKDTKGAEAYKLASEQGLEWDEVAAQMDGDAGTLYVLAEQYALTRSLPWPVSSRAMQERDALCELVYETAVRERSVPGQLPKTWTEIGLMCAVPDPEQTRSLAERHCQKTGKEMPEHKNRAVVFGETCYRLKERGGT